MHNEQITSHAESLTTASNIMKEILNLKDRATSLFRKDEIEFIVIDDDSVFRDMVTKVIYDVAKDASVKVKVKTFCTDQGINSIPEEQLKNSVLFIDIYMGCHTGPELCEMLHLTPLSKVFYISSTDTFPAKLTADIEASGHEVIDKDIADLTVKVKEIIKARCTVS